eukprot:4553077-Amphidinium_carterae.1
MAAVTDIQKAAPASLQPSTLSGQQRLSKPLVDSPAPSQSETDETLRTRSDSASRAEAVQTKPQGRWLRVRRLSWCHMRSVHGQTL